MTISNELGAVERLFLDTAPVIYFVERNPTYTDRVRPVFGRIDDGLLTAVTSPVTLAECLVHPYRLSLPALARDFTDLITRGRNTQFAPIDQETAAAAARIRARYNLSLADALQAALALSWDCDAFLTNDSAFKRVTGLNVLVLDDFAG